MPRGSNKGLPSKPLFWLAGILIVVLIGYVRVRSQSMPPAVGANRFQPSQIAAAGRPIPDDPLGSPSGLIARTTQATTTEAHFLSVVPAGASALAVVPPPNSSPDQLRGASSPTAGMMVTGIAGGRVRVAVVEIGGASSIVGVGDRIRDFTVVAISGNEVVLRQRDRTFRLPLARAETSSVAMGGAAPAVAIPTAATPAAPAATPVVASPPVAEQPTVASTLPQPPAALVISVNLGTTGYPTQTTVPVWGVPLAPAPPGAPVTPPGTTLYTPSGTSVYGFTSAPINAQSVITLQGVTALPVASNQAQHDTQVLPPGAILYTISGTSVYGFTNAPITTQSVITLQGVAALPVASNQAQSVAQVLPRPTYRLEVAPVSDQRRAQEIADRLTQAGFGAKVDATTSGQYTVTLTPPPQSTVGGGLAVIKSAGVDLPVKIELVP